MLMLVGEIVESINCTAEQRRRSGRVSHHQHSACGCYRYVNVFVIVMINHVWLWCSGQCACWRVRGGTVYVWQRRRAIIHHWSNNKSILVIKYGYIDDFCWILGCACWSCCIIEWRTRSQRYISSCFLPHTAIVFLFILIESLCRCSIPFEMGRRYGRRMSQSSHVAQQPSILVGSIATDHSRGINTLHHYPIITWVFNVDCFVCRRCCCAIGLVRFWSWRRSSSCIARSICFWKLLCSNYNFVFVSPMISKEDRNSHNQLQKHQLTLYQRNHCWFYLALLMYNVFCFVLKVFLLIFI